MAAWTREENEMCIRKIPGYRMYMKTHSETNTRKWTDFIFINREHFSTVLERHNESATGMHMAYLDKITGKKGLYQSSVSNINRKKDRVYYGILLEGMSFSETILDNIDYEMFTNSNRENETMIASNHFENEECLPDIPATSSINNSLIYLSKKNYELFESFFQYGDMESAELVFVGKEEGLGRNSALQTFNHQIKLFESKSDGFGYIREPGNVLGGFYVRDTEITDGQDSENEAFDSTMRLQTQIKYNIDTNFTTIPSNSELKQYRQNVLHRRNSKTAMFDYWPLPMQKNFPYDLDSNLPFTKNTYRDYQKSNQAKRKRLIKEMYDHYPMKLSWVYAGIEKDEFRLQDIYEDFGFVFKEYYTNVVHPKYIDILKADFENPRKFLIGERKQGNKTQYAIITPFLIGYCLKKVEVDVITTWAATILKGNY